MRRKQKHGCESMPKHIDVDTGSSGKWYVGGEAEECMEGEYYIGPIHFCPFCGVKLADWESTAKSILENTGTRKLKEISKKMLDMVGEGKYNRTD